MIRVVGSVVITAALGCGAGSNPPGQGPIPARENGHSHEKGKMLIADFGPYHVLLTAHLSKSGHELDLFVESADASGKPVALPVTVVKGTVQVRKADGGVRDVEFQPAPADERPAGEAAGTCSHFVAKVPWLEPDTELRVIVDVEADGKKLTARWNEFVPRKYAHHED